LPKNVNNNMNFDRTVKKLLENVAQDMMTVNQLGLKQLTHNITKDPRLLLDLIKKTHQVCMRIYYLVKWIV